MWGGRVPAVRFPDPTVWNHHRQARPLVSAIKDQFDSAITENEQNDLFGGCSLLEEENNTELERKYSDELSSTTKEKWQPQSAITTASSTADLSTVERNHQCTDPFDGDEDDEPSPVALERSGERFARDSARRRNSELGEGSGWRNLDDCKSSSKLRASYAPIVMIDWDDTIFPSSWVHSLEKDFVSLTAAEYDILYMVEESALHLVKTAAAQARTVIITNAECGWVELSAVHFMPRLHNLMTQLEIPVISARQFYATQTVAGSTDLNEPEVWKRVTFVTLIRQLIAEKSSLNTRRQHRDRAEMSPRKPFSPRSRRGRNLVAERPTMSDRLWGGQSHSERALGACAGGTEDFVKLNFLSIGDSDCERRAILHSRECYYSQAYFKSVKFVESPTPALLRREHFFVVDSLHSLLAIPECLDLVFETSAARSVPTTVGPPLHHTPQYGSVASAPITRKGGIPPVHAAATESHLRIDLPYLR